MYIKFKEEEKKRLIITTYTANKKETSTVSNRFTWVQNISCLSCLWNTTEAMMTIREAMYIKN